MSASTASETVVSSALPESVWDSIGASVIGTVSLCCGWSVEDVLSFGESVQAVKRTITNIRDNAMPIVRLKLYIIFFILSLTLLYSCILI